MAVAHNGLFILAHIHLALCLPVTSFQSCSRALGGPPIARLLFTLLNIPWNALIHTAGGALPVTRQEGTKTAPPMLSIDVIVSVAGLFPADGSGFLFEVRLAHSNLRWF